MATPKGPVKCFSVGQRSAEIGTGYIGPDGAVLGSRAFVLEQLEEYRLRTGRREWTALRPLPPVADWGDLVTLRGLRRHG